MEKSFILRQGPRCVGVSAQQLRGAIEEQRMMYFQLQKVDFYTPGKIKISMDKTWKNQQFEDVHSLKLT